MVNKKFVISFGLFCGAATGLECSRLNTVEMTLDIKHSKMNSRNSVMMSPKSSD